MELLAVLELVPSLDPAFAARLVAAQLAGLPQQTVGHRPDRVEPRAVIGEHLRGPSAPMVNHLPFTHALPLA